MHKVLLTVCSLAFSAAAMAEGANCQSMASAQKLAGPAKTAFLKKCEAESKTKMTLVSKNKNMSLAPTSEYGHCHQDAKDL